MLAMLNDTDTMRNEVSLIQRAASWRGARPGWLFDPEELGHIGAPTMWLIGDRDPYASPELTRRWAESMPSASFEVIPDSGHMPWLDDPTLHADKIQAFWKAANPVE